MSSFYGGPAGKSFEIKKVFSTYSGSTDSILEDISKGFGSPIAVGEFVIISYGVPGTAEYSANVDIDNNNDAPIIYKYDSVSGAVTTISQGGKYFNGTIWQKAYGRVNDTDTLVYALVTSLAATSNIDKSLLVPDKAADSKTTGDRIRELDSSIADVQADADQRLTAVESELSDLAIDPDRLGLYQDPDTGLVYVTYDGQPSSTGIPLAGGGGGGGGGGGSGNNAILTVTNMNPGGWISQAISVGAPCVISLNWSSLENEMETGNGTLTVKLGNAVKASYDVAQGNLTVDVSNYLTTGANRVKITITDIYGNAKTMAFSITCVELSLTSSFDPNVTYDADTAIQFPYIPRGTGAKTVYFYIDGTQIATASVSTSGRQVTQVLPVMTHGAHSIRVYFTADVGGVSVSSNELYYEIIVVASGNTMPIVSSSFRLSTVAQYTTLNIPYRVYNPSSLTAPVELFVGNTKVNTLTVDRTEQTWAYRPDEVGEVTLHIRTMQDNVIVEKQLNLTVTATDIDVEAETDSLGLYLTSYGRSNNEEHPERWTSGNIAATLTGFNYVSNGWMQDDDGITVLRVAGDARVTIPYKPFAQDFRATGKTIEIEFSTRDVMNYDTSILSCYSGGRGIILTAQKALLKSEQTQLATQHKEDEHVRISFVVNKRSEYRLMYIYINGIMSGAIQYADNDDFSQPNPVNISIGSNDCTIDIYNIRIYDKNLNRQQILDNWIADTQVIETMLKRYHHNDVYDEYGQVVISKLPTDLPYMVLEAPELPQYKGDSKTISGYYVDPLNATKSFTFTGCKINVQGTSSAPYARKNYDMQFKKGFEMNDGTHADTYALRDDVMPGARFVVKADVASSESVNNTGLTCLFNDTTPYKTPEMLADSRVRIGIYGFPIVIFWNNTETNEMTFLGKYNFNWPKRFPEGLGFTGDMESWEWQNNTSDRVLFKSDDFDEMYTDPDTQETFPAWKNDFEARFPEDTWEDTRKLKEFISWVVSTDRAQATNATLPSSVTIGETTYTKDSADYRLAKFKNEVWDYVEKDSAIFYYIFTELFLMADSRAKNMFPSFNGSAVTFDKIQYIDRKVVFMPYDMDTGLGTNNEGTLTYDYSLEDTDTVEGEDVFTGQKSVFWNNLRDTCRTEIVAMYRDLRSQGKLSYDLVETMYENHQAKWPEAIFNEDAMFKYIDPLIAPDPGKDATDFYLPMLQGSKAEQRKWWLYNRFRYMDSKWNAGDALSDVIQLRGYAKDNITVTPYADIYPTVKYGSYLVQERGHRGTATTLVCPLSNVSDTEIYIYSASQLASVGDLSGLKVGVADFSKATRLQNVKLGDSSASYSNPNLKSLSFGNNVLLRTIDVRNCTSNDLAHSVDISGCSNIEHVYFSGTKITGLILPNGGILKTLQLPGTITNLTIQNQRGITTFECPSYANITTLRLENVSDAVPMATILNAVPSGSRVRLIGLNLTMSTTTEIEAFYDHLDLMRGLDENGNNVDTAQVQGTITGLGNITGAWLATMQARYPGITIGYEHVTSNLYYYTYDGSELLYTETIQDGGDGGSYSGQPTRASSQYVTYTFVGWNLAKDQRVHDPNAFKNVTMDRNIYAAYSAEGAKCTIQFINGSTTLQTVNNVTYGDRAVYTGETPQKRGTDIDPEEWEFIGWDPEPINTIGTGILKCYAQYKDLRSVVVKYLEGSLQEYNSDTNTTIGSYAFSGLTKLKTAKAPATTIETRAFASCKALTTVELSSTNAATIASLAFIGCSNLDTLIIRSTTMSTLSNIDAFNKTKIAAGSGAIYVPADLVATYRADANWGIFNIASIDDYPLTDYSTIKDTWAEIFAAEADGTYTTRYSVGDTKKLTVNGVDVYMQIVAMDADDLANESGKAKITWISKQLITTHKMNYENTAADGWAATEMRTWLRETILPTIDSTVASNIKEVTKTYRTKSPNDETLSVADTLWIPSYKEVGFTTASYIESDGVVYSGVFDNATARCKYSTNGDDSNWWLRSASTPYAFSYVTSSGGSSAINSYLVYGVAPGFCT